MNDITRLGADDAEEQAIRTFHKHKRAAVEACAIADQLKRENAALMARADLLESQNVDLREENTHLRAQGADALNVVSAAGKLILELADRLRAGKEPTTNGDATEQAMKSAGTLAALAHVLEQGGDDMRPSPEFLHKPREQ